MENKKTRGYCWTDFLLEEDIFAKFKNYEYLVAGQETCPETGKVHWQCYVYFKTPRSWKSIKKLLGERHFEPCKGNALSNYKYCSKDGNLIFEDGERPQQGKRNDIERAKEIIMETGSMEKVLKECNTYQAIRIAEKAIVFMEPKRMWKTEVFWYYGKTGSGKSKTALEEANAETCWISSDTLKWWDGYDAHENVVIDDFRKDYCTFHKLLRILDRYPLRIEYKGGSRQLLAKKIWITSAYPPQQVYQTREDIGQLLRRIDKIKCFD